MCLVFVLKRGFLKSLTSSFIVNTGSLTTFDLSCGPGLGLVSTGLVV